MSKELDMVINILESKGYEVPEVGVASNCIFHDDKRPSAMLFEDGGYHCHSANCNAHFSDAAGALQYLEGCSYAYAKDILKTRFAYNAPAKKSDNVEDNVKRWEIAITKQVIKNKPKMFLAIYKTMDELIKVKDLDRLKKLHSKVMYGEIK